MTTSSAYVLARMSWPEVQKALKTIRLAIIPVGTCEQHGPNMSFDTDSAIAQALAERITGRLHPRALLAPLVPLSVSSHHAAFAGTISLRPETFEAVLWDVITSLKGIGLEHFLIVNGHGGNVAPLQVLMLKLRQQLGIQVAVMYYMQLAGDVIKAGVTSETYGHACEVEASLGLYLAPETVKPERAAGQVRPSIHAHTNSKEAARILIPFTFDDLTENGALGDARLATPEFGQRIAEAAVERTVEFLRTFLPTENESIPNTGRDHE